MKKKFVSLRAALTAFSCVAAVAVLLTGDISSKSLALIILLMIPLYWSEEAYFFVLVVIAIFLLVVTSVAVWSLL